MVFYRSVSLLSKLRPRAPVFRNFIRWLQVQTSTDLDLHSQLEELIPEQQERLKKLKKEYGKVPLGNITVDMYFKRKASNNSLLVDIVPPTQDQE